ncbi:hypothetical protein [Streptomyces sp. NPDC057794]|uniref:hypothetical protein n=1 Tax=Streptomyces sp. NPDC057794 TaxID=3346251 RepID=UPI0036946144
MKKRSMLAIASLATGFVVAAVTPSHALTENLGSLSVDDTLKTLDGTVVANDSLSLDREDGSQEKEKGKDKG